MAYDQRLAKALVELADTLVDDFEVVDLMQTLTERSVGLLDVSEAGLMLVDEDGVLRVMASTSERGRLLELFELQNEEGPCLECFATGHPVTAGPLAIDANRWPRFVPQAQAAGFRSAYALPMRLRSHVIGALNLFSASKSPMADEHVVVGQALADVATIGLLQHRAVRQARVLVEQLRYALNSRVAIEQAKGVLAEQGKLAVADAFELLRRYARSQSRGLHQTAADIVAGRLSYEQLHSPPSQAPDD